MSIEEQFNFVAAFVGNSGVGKTSILQNIITGEIQSNTTPTLIPEKFEKKLKIDNTIYNVRLWDIPGKERKLKNSNSYLRSCKAIYFVYDITKKESFEALESYWIKSVEDIISSECLVYLLGNKEDLYEQSEVTETQAKNLAKRKNYTYKSISANEEININIIEDAIKEYNKVFGKQNNISFSRAIAENNDIFESSNSTCFGGKKDPLYDLVENPKLLNNISDREEEDNQSRKSQSLEMDQNKDKLKNRNRRKFSKISEYIKIICYIINLALIIILIVFTFKIDNLLKLSDYNISYNFVNNKYCVDKFKDNFYYYDYLHYNYDYVEAGNYIELSLYPSEEETFFTMVYKICGIIIVIFAIIFSPLGLYCYFRNHISKLIKYLIFSLFILILYLVTFFIFSNYYIIVPFDGFIKYYESCKDYITSDINNLYYINSIVTLIKTIGIIIIPLEVFSNIIFVLGVKYEKNVN